MNLSLFKNELLPVYTTDLGNKVVRARELHAFLGVKERFNGWFARKVSDHQLTDNKDYCNFTEETVNKKRGRKALDYVLRLEVAKKVALGTNNAQGDKVKDYFIACEQIALGVSWSPAPAIDAHTQPALQRQNSKDVNRFQVGIGGGEAAREYNSTSCKLHSGYYPRELKDHAKKMGLPSKLRTSGKEVLRHVQPETACAMSFTDDLVKRGMPLEQAANVSTLHAKPLFQALLSVGVQPLELGR
ncbi:antA/AntB antirepressor family protein [Hymenobacter psychrophilus]|uniref:Phage anti-repressor protein n=1 Tax=Hymenobacter psychrophilus TaxID=651662 RepID=A0A1H3PKT0_9BACT|nr:antA/AntB antirepressor family protein [Hymenobacter psychrophilus]SDZ01764.1 Phage anti-repressor protein [Hymenobacter psychrophilus]